MVFSIAVNLQTDSMKITAFVDHNTSLKWSVMSCLICLLLLLAQPSVFFLLQITNHCFRYASSYLWNQLPFSFCQPHSVHCPPGSNLASAGCWRGDVRDVTWVTQDSKGKWSIEHSDIVSLTVNRKFKMRCKSMHHQWGTKSSCSLWIHSHQPTRLSSTKWRAQQPCGRRSTPTQNSTSKIV